MASKILYCWELGMGYGHVTRMAQIAQRSELAACAFTFALREVHKAAALPCCGEKQLFQAPMVLHPMSGASPNFSHLLRRCGWDNLDMAYQLIRAWRNLITQVKPDHLLVDHSPAAAAAAITLGISFKNIGNGFEIPKLSKPMESIQPYGNITQAELMAADQHIQHVFDGLNQRFGLSADEIGYASLFNPANSLLAGHPIMDHYGERAPQWRYLEMQNRADVATIDVDAIGQSGKPIGYFYIDARTHKAVDNLLLINQQFELFGHLANGHDPNTLAYLQQQGLHVFPQLLNMQQALSIADVVVSNAGAGVVNNAIHAAKPMILMPMHLEQAMIAYRLYGQKIALVLGPKADNKTKTAWLQQFASSRQIIAARMQQLLVISQQLRPYWQGNLLTDFLQNDQYK